MDDLLQEMIEPPVSKHDAARRRRLVSTVAILGLAAVGVTSLTTSALFTDTDSVTGNGFTTGTVDLEAGPPTFTFAPGTLAPGDDAYAEVTVTNDGSLELRYNALYTATNAGAADLAGQLELRVFELTGAATCDNPTPGTQLTANPISGMVAGTAATLFDTGNDNRQLIAGASERLCVVLHLPIGVGNAFQGATAGLDLQFDAEQVRNNPLP